MAKFKGSVLECVQCGAEFRVSPSRASTATTCSHPCAVKQRAKSIERKVVLNCKGCGEEFRVPRCHAERRAYCSRDCMETSPAIMEVKAARRGEANGYWKGGRVKAAGEYYFLRCSDHPFASNGYVAEHRLVMEQWLRDNDPGSEFLVKIEGASYLSPAFHVHHKDEDPSNNAIDNLQCMTPAAHRAHHQAIMQAALKFYRLHHPLKV